MNLSMKWLSDYVKIEAAPREFAHAMTMSGSKVEGYEIEASEITGVVVGKILSVDKHPNADSLVVCQLDIGKGEPIQIVTGANNVFPGATVPVATDGSTLPNGVKIKKGKLRGETSCGMLCSLSELSLTAHDFPYAVEDGIFIIEEPCEIGQDIQSAIGLNDTCVEFEITSNRPDCLSVLGLAREAAVTFDKPLTLPVPQVKPGVDNIADYLSVEVLNPSLCPRYIARMVKNVKIEPSPRWMRERLRASGVRPINNIVDITNYVMLEYGHPMHAFDHQYVKEQKIIVRNATTGETITTLDGAQRKLSPEMLVIADGENPSAVAGVMGGEFSCITDATDMIIFEAACFDGASVRTTAKKIGLRTESSGRFEKGLDPATCLPAVQRACELVQLLGAGEVIEGMIDVDASDKTLRRIKFEPEWTNGFLGIHASQEQMIDILTRLSFRVEGDDVIIPSFRADVQHKADVAEEIARIYGYENIPTTAIRGTAEGKLTADQLFEREIVQTMLAQGMNEVITYSFISPKYYDKIALPSDSSLRNCVTISNPLGEDTSVMRTTMLPSMLEVLARNYNNRNMAASLFEIGTEYLPVSSNELPIEKAVVTAGMYGDKTDFFTLKGVIETLLDRVGVRNAEFIAVDTNPTFHPGRCAMISVDSKEIGVIGEVHPAVCENYGIGVKTLVARLEIGAMMEAAVTDKQYAPLPKFPASTRDIAVLCNDELAVSAIEKAIRTGVGAILESVELFDVYKGQQIEEGKKSVAYNITMRAKDRTLTDEEADAAIKRTLKELDKIGAAMRS